MMLKKSEVKGFWNSIKACRKEFFVILEALYLLFLWVISPFVTDALALVISLIAAFVVSLVMVPGISCLYNYLRKKDLLDEKLEVFILYGTSYLLTLYLTIELLQKFVNVFNIDNLKQLQFALQVLPFLLYVAMFLVFRNPKQLQYWAYAVAYGGFLIWEWAINWGIAGDSTEPTLKFTLDFFITPFKEAMLLFIIWDTYSQAKEKQNENKNKLPRSKPCTKKEQKRARHKR